MFKTLKVLKGVGILGGLMAAGVAAGAAVLVKKWKGDADSGDLRVVLMNGRGVKLSKSEEGRIIVDTHYDVNEDEAVRGEEPAMVVDLPERAREAADAAGENVRAAAEIAADKAGAAAEQLWEKSEDLRAKAEEKAGELWEKSEGLREKAGETAEQLREKAAVVAEQVREKAGECCDCLSKVAQLAKEQAAAFFADGEAAAEEGKAEAAEAVEAAQECCREYAEKGEKDLEDLAESAADAAKEAADSITPEE